MNVESHIAQELEIKNKNAKRGRKLRRKNSEKISKKALNKNRSRKRKRRI